VLIGFFLPLPLSSGHREALVAVRCKRVTLLVLVADAADIGQQTPRLSVDIRSRVPNARFPASCLADPSFHDGNGPLEAVWADAETDKGGTDRAGSNANAVSRVQRSMPERRTVSCSATPT
jgi:hypothetical protein